MAEQGFELRPPGLQPVGEPWVLAYEFVIRVQMRPQPLSDLGGVTIVFNRAEGHPRKFWVGQRRRVPYSRAHERG